MANKPEFYLAAAHKYFSAHCFNTAWNHIDKATRTEPEEEEMTLLAMAALWHWTQREDCTNQNLSMGYWQAARVFALIGNVELARSYSLKCRNAGVDEDAFFKAYTCEAQARAEMVAGDIAAMQKYLDKTQAFTEQVTDKVSRQMLPDDLKTIR